MKIQILEKKIVTTQKVVGSRNINETRGVALLQIPGGRYAVGVSVLIAQGQAPNGGYNKFVMEPTKKLREARSFFENYEG